MLQLDDPPSFMEAMFAQAAAMHASAIRLDVAPALVFSSQGRPPDFSGLDEVVALAQRYDLSVVGDLLTIPTWMADCATPTSTPSRCATDDLSGYASVISQIAARADPAIRDWEVWNEPDTTQFFDGTPQQYALMLRTAHDAIKSVDPADNVLLGGVSSVAATGWLAQVFATPGADAIHAFDIANLHERGDLWQLAPDVAGFRQFLATQGFDGPLWITEHGYPSDPQYQYDPGYTGGAAAQASFLEASVPTLIDAGAAEVFVTERDNLSGPFASEGVLGGDVADPPPANPQIVIKPAFGVVQAIAECFAQLGRDCPGSPATASPSTAFLPPAPPGHGSTTPVTVTDPGSVPIALGAATVTGPYAGGLAVASNGCAGMVLEPRETCTVSVASRRWRAATPPGRSSCQPTTGCSSSRSSPRLRRSPACSPPSCPTRSSSRRARATGSAIPSDGGSFSPTRSGPRCRSAGRCCRAPDARRFHISSDRCAHATLRPHGGCRLTVMFTPTRPGTARGELTLSGTGSPLTAQLRPVAFALPAVMRLTASAGYGCAARAWTPMLATVSQAATIHWTLARTAIATAIATATGAARNGACPRAGAPAGPVVASGTVRARPRPAGDAAEWSLPGLARLTPGGYVLTVSAVNDHGAGPARSLGLVVRP